ncbi:MAG: hypothetical protein R3F60_22545 [bacterium]
MVAAASAASEVAPVTSPPAAAAALAEADALLAENPAAALVWIESHPEEGSASQRLLRRGLGRLKADKIQAGLADLAAAFVDDAALAADPRVLPALLEVLDEREADEAVGLLAGPAGRGAGPRLLAAVAEAGLRARWRLVDALEKAEAPEARPARFAALRRDLRLGDCERRRKAAEALGAWGDGAALPDLKRARGRGFLDNLCMSGEIDAAIRALKDAPASAE